jgi:hypothetical protein
LINYLRSRLLISKLTVSINATSMIGILQLLLLQVTVIGYITYFSNLCSRKSLNSSFVNVTKCPVKITLKMSVWVTVDSLNYKNIIFMFAPCIEDIKFFIRPTNANKLC